MLDPIRFSWLDVKLGLRMLTKSITTVGLLASIVPARRGLSVQPIEALREE